MSNIPKDDAKVYFQHAIANIIGLADFKEHYDRVIASHKTIDPQHSVNSSQQFRDKMRLALDKIPKGKFLSLKNIVDLGEHGWITPTGFVPNFCLSETACRIALKLWPYQVKDLTSLGFELNRNKLQILCFRDKQLQSITIADTLVRPVKGALSTEKGDFIWNPIVDVESIPLKIPNFKKQKMTRHNGKTMSREEVKQLFGWSERTMRKNSKKFKWF